MQIKEYYKYSIFADLSYVDWDIYNTQTLDSIKRAVRDPDNPKGPEALANDLFDSKGWNIQNFQENDDVGFKASLYVNGNEKVLAIAGTEGLNIKDWKDNLFGIGHIGVAIDQAVSLFNYIMRLTAPDTATDVLQVEWKATYSVDSNDLPPGRTYIPGSIPTEYYYLERSNTGKGEGIELTPDDKITLTGHSLGGHLAAFALRLFPNLFDQAVSFNAPGFDPWSSQGKTDQIVNELFAEYLDHDPKTFTELENENRLHVLESEDSVPGNDDDLVSGIECGIKSAEEIFG